MAITRRATAVAAIAATSLSALLLAGCAEGGLSESDPEPPPSPSTDTAPGEFAPSESAPPPTGDACGVATAQIEDAGKRLEELQSQAGSDPSAIGPALREIQGDLDEAAAGIDDPEVGDALERAADAADGLAEQVDAVSADPGNISRDEITAAATELQDSFTAVGELCG